MRNCIICGAGRCACGGPFPLKYPPVGAEWSRDMTLLGSGMMADTNAAYVAKERLYLDADGNVVKEGDPARVELLVGENGVLPRDKAAQYGLISADAPADEDAPKDENNDGTTDGLESLTVAALREQATALNVQGVTGMNKAALVAAVRGATPAV